MVDVKWTEFPTGTPVGTDLIPFVSDPGGTPENQTTTFDDLANEVYVEDPNDPGTYVQAPLYIGETDPAIGGDDPYVWVDPTVLADPATLLPWHITWLAAGSVPDASTGTTTVVVPGDIDSTQITTAARYNTNTDQNDEISWDHVLAAGTWDIHVWVRKSSNTAILTVLIDGVSVGTADTYAASPTGAQVSVTGATVALTGKKRITFKAATKNASSSDYVMNLMTVELRRTA